MIVHARKMHYCHQADEAPNLVFRKTENEAYRGGLDNWTKDVMIVHARMLMKIFCSKTRFILVNIAIE